MKLAGFRIYDDFAHAAHIAEGREGEVDRHLPAGPLAKHQGGRLAVHLTADLPVHKAAHPALGFSSRNVDGHRFLKRERQKARFGNDLVFQHHIHG